MSLFLNIAIIGLVATLAMTLFLVLVHTLKIANVDMLTAIGTLFTTHLRKAFAIGLVLHLTAGVVFAFIILSAASYLGFHTWFDFVFFGSMIGFAQGLVVSFLTVVLVAEHHPLRRFRQSGFKVVAAHAVAHMIYGFTLGFMTALMQPDLESMKIFGTGIL